MSEKHRFNECRLAPRRCNLGRNTRATRALLRGRTVKASTAAAAPVLQPGGSRKAFKTGFTSLLIQVYIYIYICNNISVYIYIYVYVYIYRCWAIALPCLAQESVPPNSNEPLPGDLRVCFSRLPACMTHEGDTAEQQKL